MSNDNYHKVDKLAIFEEQEERAGNQVALIEQRCESSPVAFIKENYNYIKLRYKQSEPEIRITIGAAMVKAAGHIGIKTIDMPNKQDISRMILSSYNDLTLEEIYKAFELERYGNYDEKTEHFQLFNAEYVAAILKKYKNWKQTTKMQHNISPPSSLPEITESKKEEILVNGIIRVFDEYETTGIMPEPNNYIFDDLYERKIIPDGNTPEIQAYYQKKYNQATAEIQKELKTNVPLNKNENRAIADELQKIIDNNSDKVAARVKKIILTEYFAKLIKEGKHIKDLLPKP